MSGYAFSSERYLTSQRIYLYDNIKFLAILLVVMGHFIDVIAAHSSDNWARGIFLTIYSVHMPLFIFISGLFVKPMDKSSKFPKQRVISFVLIGIAMRIAYLLLDLMLGNAVKYSVFDMYDTFAWFMWAMAVFNAIIWLFREYNTKVLLVLSLLIGCAAGYDSFLGDKFALMRITVFLPFFIAGYMINPEKLTQLLSNRILKLAAFFIVIGFIFVFFKSQTVYNIFRPMFTGRHDFTSLKDLYNLGFLVRLASYLISGVFGFSIMCLVVNVKIPFISAIGTKTIQIYFWHKLFLSVLISWNYFDVISAGFNEPVTSIIIILTAVAVTFICSVPIFSFPAKQLLAFGKSS